MVEKRECASCGRSLPVAAFSENTTCRVCTAIGYARARKFPRDHAARISKVLEDLKVPELIAARANVKKAA